jgi:hypothetical protein
MVTVQEILDKIDELPKEEFEEFDDDYKRFRVEKKREGFLKTYREAMIAKQKGELFAADDIQSLIKWLNE